MRVVVVPPVPALLPAYASLTDPVGDLRAACLAAVSWLGRSVEVVADDGLGRRVGEWLLASRDGHAGSSPGGGSDLLVLANGSACRSEKAPGHLDERSSAFDEALGAALARGDTAALADLDGALGRELQASGLGALRSLAARLPGTVVESAGVDFEDDPFGVKYWVVRWQCAS